MFDHRGRSSGVATAGSPHRVAMRLAGVLVLACAVSACGAGSGPGTGGPTGGAGQPGGGTGTAGTGSMTGSPGSMTGSPGSVTGTGSAAVSGAAAGSAGSSSAGPSGATPVGSGLLRYRLSATDLPSGWRDSQARDAGYRLTVCGVDLEPEPPTEADTLRFAQSAVGPFVEQYLRAYDGTTVASRVLGGLASALPTCTHYSATNEDTGQKTDFRVEPLRVDGLATGDVAWRQTSINDHPITADYVMARRGDTVVLLAAYALTGPPPAGVIDAAYAAVRGKP